jgi:hypothetical protein
MPGRNELAGGSREMSPFICARSKPLPSRDLSLLIISQHISLQFSVFNWHQTEIEAILDFSIIL